MRLYLAHGYWRRTTPGTRTTTLHEMLVATSDDEARDLAAQRWRAVFATLDGEPAVTHVRTLDAVDGAADSPRYRALGNAVCVNVAEWIGRRIMAPHHGATADA